MNWNIQWKSFRSCVYNLNSVAADFWSWCAQANFDCNKIKKSTLNANANCANCHNLQYALMFTSRLNANEKQQQKKTITDVHFGNNQSNECKIKGTILHLSIELIDIYIHIGIDENKITTWNATTDWIHFNWFQRESPEPAEKHRTNQKSVEKPSIQWTARKTLSDLCGYIFHAPNGVWLFPPIANFFGATSSFSDNQKPIEPERPVWEEDISFGFAGK